MDALPKELGDELEQTYVKHTYDNIAQEFSGTRHKKWPKVEQFVESLPKTSLLLDVGCGNGKYLDNTLAFSIGCDVSRNLLSICKGRGFEVVLGDMTRLPFRESAFDAIICVAALHHIVTAQRRQTCLEDMTKLMISESGKLLVQVWAYEQNLEKDNPYLKRNKSTKPTSCSEILNDKICFKNTVELPVHENRTPFVEQDLLVPFKVKQSPGEQGPCEMNLRYYHVFKEKELESMFTSIKNIKLADSYYDRGNWCTIVTTNQ